ncbi:MAG: hypothetical protein NWQ38_10755 [Cellulophaga sp.]|nr:hypothetical protein [Cellulophaga sp.]
MNIKLISSLGFINVFFILASLLNVFNLGYLFSYVTILLIIFQKEFLKIAIDRNFLLLLFFSFVYGLFYSLSPFKSTQFVIIYMFTPPVFYLWGKYISTKINKTIIIFYILIVLTIIYSLPAIISVGLNIIEGGFAQPERNLPMFWGSDDINATAMGAFFVFNMCIPALLLVSYKEIPKVFFVILLVIFIISVACVLRIGSRTQLAIILLSLIISLFIATPKMSIKQNITIYSVVGILVFFIATKVSFDLDSDIMTSFAGRMKDKGGSDIASGGGRTQLWEKSIDNLFEKPLGWDLNEFGYSHNLWLDALRVGGIISFIILILYFLRVVNLVRKIISVKLFPVYFQILCLTYLIAFFSLFMVEPGIDGTFTLFILFCLFVGLVRQHYYDIKLNVNSIEE